MEDWIKYEDKECETCNGEGSYEVDPINEYVSWTNETCLECEGSGTIEVEIYIQDELDEKQEIYKRSKLDILQSNTIEQLETAKKYMDLSQFLIDFSQWNDLLKNYELKKRMFKI